MRTHAVLYTDVLVIGAGAAASRAALESERAGADTVMITKRRFGSAGTSTFRVAESAGFSASGFADPEDSPAVHEKDILDAALWPCSRKLAGIVAENAPRQVPFLEGLGVVFQRYGDGYLATKGCFASRRRSMKIKGHGEPIVLALKREIERRGPAPGPGWSTWNSCSRVWASLSRRRRFSTPGFGACALIFKTPPERTSGQDTTPTL